MTAKRTTQTHEPPPDTSPSSTSEKIRRRRIPRVVLLIESSRASGRRLLTGIANYARFHGPWAFFWEPAGLKEAWPRVQQLDAQGIILRDVDAVDEVARLGIPAVVVGHSRKEIPGFVNVTTDSGVIGSMAATHLIERGFQHFAFCGYADTPWSQWRGESFSTAVRAAGFENANYLSPEAKARTALREELQAMAKWLRGQPKPLGLMACNDDRGRQVIEACKRAGLRVPGEVAIIAADNDELVCDLSEPPLSSIAINFERAGFESAQALDLLMRGAKTRPSHILAVATHIVTRQSTDILAIPDAGVAKALRFIREHARQAIHVDTVAEASGLSRRVLEKRFRNHLHRSVMREIRRVRVDQICRMLVETNQSIAEIASALGYSSVEHIARYFRSEKPYTPLAYRKHFAHR